MQCLEASRSTSCRQHCSQQLSERCWTPREWRFSGPGKTNAMVLNALLLGIVCVRAALLVDLGSKNLEDMNHCLLLKFVHKLHEANPLPWKRWLISHAGTNFSGPSNSYSLRPKLLVVLAFLDTKMLLCT